jgi:quinoprotein glucose dehydrogenase
MYFAKKQRWIQFGVAAALAAAVGAEAGQKEPAAPAPGPYSTWRDYGGSADSMQYSALRQIDKTNVSGLELVWSYAAPGPFFRVAFNPLVVDDTMYVLGKDGAIVALDAAAGTVRWSYTVDGSATSRGFNYWESPDRTDRRLLFSAKSFLHALDARTGRLVESFGTGGRIDLRDGLPRAREAVRGVQSNTPGRVFENLIILGTAPGEDYEAVPGDLRAFDVRTGQLVWTFHTIPHPGELGYDTWPPDAWKTAGAANAWGEISVDEKRGIAYFPLGSPTYDFYGADRTGQNLFGDCLLALDARTGKRLWHFQAVHHDLWDYDLTAGPKLLTVKHEGKSVDVVAQATKSGFVYVFDRVTGEPIWPIEERPVPQSDIPGEHSWATQPFPVKPPPFVRQKVTVDDLNPHVPEAEKKRWREFLDSARNEGVFTPPSLRDTVGVPGQYGGANWGSTAGDPETGMLYVRAIDAPTLNRLTTERPAGLSGEEMSGPRMQGRMLYRQSCFACHGPGRSRLTAVATIGRERFEAVVKNGQGQMPGFPDMKADDIDRLYTFLAESRAPAPAPPAASSASAVPGENTRYYGQFGQMITTANGLPLVGAPWSEIVAYDLNEGTIRWRTPLGTAPELSAKGIKDTGAVRPTKACPVVTAGGLVLIGTAGDQRVRAYDKDDGRLLWEKDLGVGPSGMPAVYEVAGREYIAFYAASGGFGFASRTAGGAPPAAQGYYVFALPKTGAR